MKSNVIKNESVQKSPIELHQSKNNKAVMFITRDVTEQALLNNALRLIDEIERQSLPINDLLSENERLTGLPPEEANREETDFVSLSSIDDIIEHSSLMGAALGRSITRPEYEYIRRNWRSFFNSPMRFAKTDTVRMIEEELKTELLLNKLCSR